MKNLPAKEKKIKKTLSFNPAVTPALLSGPPAGGIKKEEKKKL